MSWNRQFRYWHSGIILIFWYIYQFHSGELSGVKECSVKGSWMHLFIDGKWFSRRQKVIWVHQVEASSLIESFQHSAAFKTLFSSQQTLVRNRFGQESERRMPESCSQTFSDGFPFVPSWHPVVKSRFSSSSVYNATAPSAASPQTSWWCHSHTTQNTCKALKKKKPGHTLSGALQQPDKNKESELGSGTNFQLIVRFFFL